MVSLARKNLLHDRTRFVITVSGVAFAVTLVLVQVGLFMGLLDKATVTIRNADADLWVTSRETPNVDFAHAFPETTVLRVRGVDGVERADNLIVAFMNIMLPSGAEEGCLVYALEDFTAWNLPWNVEEGRTRDLHRGRYILMDRSAERRFGAFAAGEHREILGRRYKIIGSTREAASFTTAPIVFMDYLEAQEIGAFLRGKTSYVLVRLAPGADPQAVKAAIARVAPHNDVYTRDEWAARSRRYWVVSTGLGMNMGITVFLGILVGIVVVAQTLYTSAVEHVREFGTVKAIGGSNRDIYRILGEQALIAALVGFVVGGAISWAMRPAMAKLHLNVLVSPEFAAMVFVGTVLMCLGAALFSFRRVAGIDPALVFRT
ncbi:MAG TPA: ABC transporter permease [Vicinamibacteria bacterium]|nr:ABC transporter permease [Vicinamibacteria bacterium]